jgi:hypothetical protein
MRFAMTPAQIQLSHSIRLMVHEWASAFGKLSDKQIEEVMERIDKITEFFASRRKRDDAA